MRPRAHTHTHIHTHTHTHTYAHTHTRAHTHTHTHTHPTGPAAYMFAPSRRDKAGHKWEQSEQLGRGVESVHVLDVYTDGSYAEEAPGECFAGYGVWFGPMHPQNLSSHLDGPMQTNNWAELTACIEALCTIPLSQPIHVIADSKYMYDGVTTYMHRWALQGRQISNHDLWDSLWSLMHSRSAEMLWKHLYSHR